MALLRHEILVDLPRRYPGYSLQVCLCIGSSCDVFVCTVLYQKKGLSLEYLDGEEMNGFSGHFNKVSGIIEGMEERGGDWSNMGVGKRVYRNVFICV